MEKGYTTDEFISDLQNQSFVGDVELNETENKVIVYDMQHEVIAEAMTKVEKMANTMFPAFIELTSAQQTKLQAIVMRYAQTPTTERSEGRYFLVPIVSPDGKLKAKFLYQAKNGLTIRVFDDDPKTIKYTDQVLDGYVFTEAHIKRLERNPGIFFDYSGKMEIKKRK